MFNKSFQYFLILFFIFFSAEFINSQDIATEKKDIVLTIEKILANSSSFENNEVEVTGLVTQYVKGKGKTSYYLLKGDYGAIIKVNTAEPAPETNKKYTVRGIFYFDRANRRPFISEKSKIKIDMPITPPPDVEQIDWITILIYVAIGIVAILIIVLIVTLLKKREVEEPVHFQQTPPEQHTNTKETTPNFSSDDDFKTIKIVTTSPKTLKYIPGKLVINDGPDRGKEFRIAGYPTSEGSIVSIGRKNVTGDRAYSHIRLNEKTVSREQAILILRDNKLYVKNLSETNLTQVNGEELKLGEIVELRPESTLRTGEIEFKYII